MTDTPSHAVPSVGDTIAGKYRIDGTLGTGGMGIVFAANHLALDRTVAVKVMRAEMAEHAEAVERLLLEAKLAARFRGEHVCRVLDVGTLPSGVPFIVMEYLEGADLATLLGQQGSFDVPTAVDFVMEASEALAEAHLAQIVHRDLKPENLFVTRLLDSTPSIKVLDFGISKQLGASGSGRSLTNPSAALGSPYYMAPEQMRSAKDADSRADIWALGAILFELLTGRQAFGGETLPEVCAAVMHTEPARVSEIVADVPDALADLIDRCLRKDPGQRFSNVGELAALLAPFGSERAVASLERIQRMLAGKDVDGARFERDLSGRFRVGGSRAPTPRAAPRSPSAPQIKVTLTTGAASSMVQPEPRQKLPWVAATSAVLLGAALVWFVTSRGARFEAPSVAPPAHAAMTLPIERTPPTLPEAVAPAAEAPGASATSATPLLAAPRRPWEVPGGGHRARGAPKPVSAATATSATPTASPQAPRRPKPVEAWDPTSFGPRR